jgi:IS605 OrfB family transposase
VYDMLVTTTVKVKLYTDPSSDAAFKRVCQVFSDACDHVSAYVFRTQQMTCSRETIHEQLYDQMRAEFGLKSQMTCSVFRTVMSKYRTIDRQYRNEPYTFRCGDRRYSVPRDLDWLQRPVRFRKPFLELVRGRDWSFVRRDGAYRLSINTLEGRRIVDFNHHFDQRLGIGCDDRPRLGGAKLLKRKGSWYLYISTTVDVEEPAECKRIVGHDRGLRFLVTSFDGKDTVFVNGIDIAARRERYHRTRKSLQAKNTRGARRVLRRISGRENRWMSDVNHCLSKTLTSQPDTLHVLEDLTGISFAEKNLSGKDRARQLRSWPFYDLEQKMIYKAKLNHSKVISVPASYTSQRCPVCGHTHKGNRRPKEHLFVCRKCGCRSNDDRIAAMNIRELGVRYMETGKLAGFPKQ